MLTKSPLSQIPGAQPPFGTVPGTTFPGGTPPFGTAPGTTFPGGTPPFGSVPGTTFPGGTLPGGTFPGGSFPGGTFPGGTLPGGTFPGGTLPGGSFPGTTPSGATGTMFPMTSGPSGVVPPAVSSGSIVSPTGMTFSPPPREESYVENILRMNLGKVGTFYMTYENNSEWNAKIFKGVVEAAGRDHIVISDPATGRRFLLLTLNLDYVTFDEPLNYNLPFGSQGASALPTR